MVRLTAAAAVLALSVSSVLAGTDSKDLKEIKEVPITSCSDKDWTLELGSGVSWSNVRTSGDASYTFIPINLTASLKLDEIGNDQFLGGIFRGYSEFYFRGDYDQIVHGPENWIAGIMVGPRYNFVQPGWKIIPFIEGGVGIDFADSNPQAGGLGQDFNFSFGVGAGVKYDISCDWFVRLAVDYQHFSNAGLSEPASKNKPIDSLGPKISFGYAF